jgi:hypothetical protein
VTAVLLLLAGCGGERDVEPQAEAPATAPAEPERAAPDTAITVPFSPVDGATASGNVRVEADGGRTMLTVALRGSRAGVYHGLLHEGRCAARGGSLDHMEPVVADATGAGEALSAIDLPITMLLDGRHIIVYNDPDGTPVACADLPAV